MRQHSSAGEHGAEDLASVGSSPAAAITLAAHRGFALIEAADTPFLYRRGTDAV